VVSGWGGFIEKLIPGGKLYEMETAKTGVSATHITAVLGSFAFAITGVLFSLLFYLESVQYFDPAKWTEKFKGIYNLLINRYYIDDKIVNGFLIKYLLKFEDILAKFDLLGIDRLVDNTAEMVRSVSNASGKADLKYIDGAVDGVGEGVLTTGQKLRVIQSGNIRQYISWIVGGAFVILIIVVIISKVYY
jgi:NADH:ubiquinone oxidoreductase subunit 5 (subunit L)/multisubunit Na+/H+ antiporter MnhA subunit